MSFGNKIILHVWKLSFKSYANTNTIIGLHHNVTVFPSFTMTFPPSVILQKAYKYLFLLLCDSINANFTFIVWQRKYKTCHSKQHDSKKKHISFLDSEALPIVWLIILTQEYSNVGLYQLDRIDETNVITTIHSVPWNVRIQSYDILSMKIKLSSNINSDVK